MHSVTGDQVPGPDDEEQPQLNQELDEIADDNRERDNQSGKIHFSENVRVADKRCGCFVEALREIIPQRDTGQIEQRGRNSIGADFGNVAKHDHVDQRGHDGLHKEPNRSQDGLLINGDDVPFNKHVQQVAVFPNLLEIHVQQMTLGTYDQIPCGFAHFAGVVSRQLGVGSRGGHKFCGSSEQKLVLAEPAVQGFSVVR